MSKNDVSLRDVYQVTGELRREMNEHMSEIKGIIKEMKKFFDELEAGRLTRLESAFAKLTGEREALQASAKANAAWVAIVVSAVGIVMSLLIALFIK